MIFRLAAWLDRHEARLHKALEPLQSTPAWFREFRDYLRDPRLTLEEFWIRYAVLRYHTQPRLTAPDLDAETFFRTSEYPLYRQIVHRRHTSWRRVLVTMRGTRGHLLEVGCGIAPVSAYCATHRPEWTYWLDDLPSAHFTFGEWRVRQRASCVPVWPDETQVITMLDVLEHLPDPLFVAEHALHTLRPGGYLHWNLTSESSTVGLNLASPAACENTRRFLKSALVTHYESPIHIVSQKS